MNRHYTPAEYEEIVENLRSAFPDCAITTDVMVGFAGETEEEFGESLAFVRKIGLAKAHVFAYSQRPGTRAWGMEGQVSRREKERRSALMIQAAKEGQQAFLREQLGREEEVLFEQEKAPGLWEGYTRNYTPVLLASGKRLAGELVRVKLMETQGENVIAEGA